MPPSTVILLLVIFLLCVGWYLFIKFKNSPKINNLVNKTFDAPPEDTTKEVISEVQEVKTRIARKCRAIKTETESLKQQQDELDSFLNEKPVEKPVRKRKPRKLA